MKKIFKFIFRVLLIIILLGAITTWLDYTRMSSGDLPIFSIKSYNNNTKIQNFKGIFYNAQRKVKVNENESLIDSNKISFKVFSYKLTVPKQYKNNDLDYQLNIEKTSDCQDGSILYYADENIKVYTHCLDSIKVKTGKKDEELNTYLKTDKNNLTNILNSLDYAGLNPNSDVLMYLSNDEITTNKLKVYQCNMPDVKDVYIGGEDMEFQADFCTAKDDDFKFLAKLKEELPKDFVVEKDQYDLLFEDEENKYEIEKGKTDYIFLIAKAHRGIPEEKKSLREVIDNNIMTIEELQKKGLKVNIIKKNEESNSTSEE